MLEGGLEKALESSTKSPEFVKAVVWLASELKALCKLDEQINDFSSSEDAASFLLELSSFLKEIGIYFYVFMHLIYIFIYMDIHG